jgi:hypothetical protein
MKSDRLAKRSRFKKRKNDCIILQATNLSLELEKFIRYCNTLNYFYLIYNKFEIELHGKKLTNEIN